MQILVCDHIYAIYDDTFVIASRVVYRNGDTSVFYNALLILSQIIVENASDDKREMGYQIINQK